MTRIATFRLSATRQLKQYRIRVVDERDTRPTSKRPPLFGQTDLVLRKSMNMSSSRRGLLRLIDVAGFHAGLRFTRAADVDCKVGPIDVSVAVAVSANAHSSCEGEARLLLPSSL